MLFLYALLLLLLGAARFLIGRRVASLEKKYVRAAKAVLAQLHAPAFKEGNTGRHDPTVSAKRQFLLGLLAQQRDRLEAKHDSWVLFAEKFGRLVAAVRAWKGKALPYTFGVVDVVTALTLIDYLGFGEYLSGRHLVELITSLLAR